MRKLVFQILGPVLISTLLCGCAGSGKNREESDVPPPRVDEKYRLTEDRKKFEELRSQVPEERQIENDEMALLQKLMGEIKQPPMQVRDKFDNIARKKREIFNRDMDKQREKFNSEERKAREGFNKQVEKERNDFQRRKRTTEERKEFYDGIDERRKSFNADIRTKRDDFEADVRQKRKDFEDYMREKTSNFSQEYRAYTQRWNEYQKQKNTTSPSSNSQ